jgi:hypothetical protein
MARNGSGTFNRLYDWTDERDAGNDIDSTKMDAETDGIASALTDSLSKDGQTVPSANLPMGGFKHTGVAVATARTHYAAVSQVQDGSFTLLGSVSGTNTITGSTSPSIAAYAEGQRFNFTTAGANTGAATLNVNSVGAKAITKSGTGALLAGDLASGALITVEYDGTRFQVVGGLSLGFLTTRGDIITQGASAPQRTAIGPAGFALTSDGTDADYAEIKGRWMQIGATQTISAGDSVVDFDDSGGYTIDASYDDYMLRLDDVLPTADGSAELICQVFQADSAVTAGNYSYFTLAGSGSSDTPAGISDGGAGVSTGFTIAVNVGATAGEGFTGEITLWNPSGASFPSLNWVGNYASSTPNVKQCEGGGRYLGATTAADGLRLAMSTSTLKSGTVSLHGRKNA